MSIKEKEEECDKLFNNILHLNNNISTYDELIKDNYAQHEEIKNKMDFKLNFKRNMLTNISWVLGCSLLMIPSLAMEVSALIQLLFVLGLGLVGSANATIIVKNIIKNNKLKSLVELQEEDDSLEERRLILLTYKIDDSNKVEQYKKEEKECRRELDQLYKKEKVNFGFEEQLIKYDIVSDNSSKVFTKEKR